MKQRTFLRASIFTLSALLMTACNKQQNEAEEEETAPAATTSQVTSTTGVRIAYVEVDTLMSQYQYCKDYSVLLTKKGENIQRTLQSKAKALQDQANTFQSKLQQNAYTQEEAQRVQQSLARQQQDLQALNDRLSNEFAAEQTKFNDAMRDSIHSFLKSYNKTKKYDLILTKSGDNILYANAAYDITNEVVKGLNKRYKPSAEVASMKK
jgi:outer membrane protein